MIDRLGLAAIGLAAATLIGAALTQPAASQAQVCGPRDRIVAGLERDYGETRVFSGLHGQVLVEYFRSALTGTWTMLVTRPGGIACLAAQGVGFEADPVAQRGEGA